MLWRILFVVSTLSAFMASAADAPAPAGPTYVMTVEEHILSSMRKWSDVVRLANQYLAPEDKAYFMDWMKKNKTEISKSTEIQAKPNGLFVGADRIQLNEKMVTYQGMGVPLDGPKNLGAMIEHLEKLMKSRADSAVAVGEEVGQTQVISGAIFVAVWSGKMMMSSVKELAEEFSLPVPVVVSAIALNAATVYGGGRRADSVGCEGGQLILREKDGDQISRVKAPAFNNPNSRTPASQIEEPQMIKENIRRLANLIKDSEDCSRLFL